MRERDLIALGYEKRGVFDEPRLSEVVELYKELGFEVVILDYEGGEEEGCLACFKSDDRKGLYKVVFTRKGS